MDWNLPKEEPSPPRSVLIEATDVERVVYTVWTAVEKHVEANKFEAAVLLLDRLLSSPYGTTVRSLHLRSRIRLAQLCSTRIQLIDTAIVQLNQAVRSSLYSVGQLLETLISNHDLLI